MLNTMLGLTQLRTARDAVVLVVEGAEHGLLLALTLRTPGFHVRSGLETYVLHRGALDRNGGGSTRSLLGGFDGRLSGFGRVLFLQHFLVDGKLDGISGGFGSEVVHTGLQSSLPGVEVHGGELAEIDVVKMDIETLTLVNEGTTVGSHLNQILLFHLPHGLVEVLEVLRDFGDVLNGSVGGDELSLKFIGPEAKFDQVDEEVTGDADELTSQSAADVDVGGVRLKALVVSEDLGSGGSGHRGEQKGIADTVLGDLLLKTFPVPAVTGGDTPHIILELSFADGGAFIRLIRSVLLGEILGSGEGGEVNGLEDLLVQLFGCGTFEGESEEEEGVSKTLDSNTDGAVSQVGSFCFRDWVVVDVNDLVQVAGDDLRDFIELLMIEFGTIGYYEAVKGN